MNAFSLIRTLERSGETGHHTTPETRHIKKSQVLVGSGKVPSLEKKGSLARNKNERQTDSSLSGKKAVNMGRKRGSYICR